MGQDGDRTLVGWFEAQVERSAHAIALEADDQRLSYRELDERANRLAHLLIARGVRPEAAVGVLLPRSVDLVVALWAVWKAGGVQVPLDPSYPIERLRGMAAAAQVAVVITRDSRTGELLGAPILDLTAAGGALSGQSSERPSLVVTPRHAACVFFTSGSTGTPNPVVIEHAMFVQLMTFVCTTYELGERDRVLQLATPSFVVSVEELYAILLCGGTLVLWPERLPGSPSELAQGCARLGITVLQVLTPYWHKLVDAVASGQVRMPDSLRLVFIGGEQVRPRALARWHAHVGARIRLVNEYGATESGNTSTMCELTAATGQRHLVPIGAAIRNVSIYVLDERGEPVGDGDSGELFVAGAGLARGYLGQPGRTAAKFLPDPFGGRGRAMYRTGDVVRRLPGGLLEYLGRADDQVKLRGYRIELGEIEAALTAHPAVREAVVMARGQPSGERQLVAYWVGDREQVTLATLREHLKRILPDHMVPAALVALAELPLSPNGKIDRAALPDPADDAFVRETYAAPASDEERLVARIWSDVLGVAEIGAEDNFFALGGHSALAIDVIDRIRQELAVELPVNEVFRQPTVAALAAAVRSRLEQAAVPAIRPLGASPEAMPVLPIQAKLFAIHREHPNMDLENQGVALRLCGAVDRDALGHALDEIYRRHDILRAVFHEAGGEVVQRIRPPGPLALRFADVPGDDADARWRSVCELVDREWGRPFDLTSGPPIEATLWRLADDDCVLQVKIHHIAFDGASYTVLLRELATLYSAFHEGRRSPLAPLRYQMTDYAVWQRELPEHPDGKRQLAYWRALLEGARPTLLRGDLAVAQPFLVERSAAPPLHPAVVIPLEVPLELGQRVRALAGELQATPFVVLLAAFATLVARESGTTDVCTNSSYQHRELPGTAELIGPIFNILAMRLPVRADRSVRQLVRTVLERVVDARRNAGVSIAFEPAIFSLIQHLNFNYEQAPPSDEVAGFAGLRATLLPAPWSPFVDNDLAFFVQEAADRFIGNAVCNAKLFSPAAARRLVSAFVDIMARFCEAPDQPLAALLAVAPEREDRTA